MTSCPISEEEILRLVDEFYAKVRVDPDLAPIFGRAIPGDWAPHLATIRNFWSSVMRKSGRYQGNPVGVHLGIEGMEPRLFERWLELFNERAGNCSMRLRPTHSTPRPRGSPKASSLPSSTGPTGLGPGQCRDLRRNRQLHKHEEREASRTAPARRSLSN
jgi:hypothetical protein